jgi:hypothetical protein
MPDMSDALRKRIAEDQQLNGALSRLFSESPEEAREMLKSIAARWDTAEDDAADTIRLYSGMTSSLSEDDFRWCGAKLVDLKRLRRHRLEQYQRFRELFELEVEAALEIRRSSMARWSDWSEMESYCLDWAVMARSKLILRLAGGMFRFRIPGAVDLCDWGAWMMYKEAYRAA